MDDIATIRAGLERLLQSTAERHQQLDIREQELAAAMELLSIDPRIQAAFNDGAAEARRRVQLLIQEQLNYLRPCSSTALVLKRLSEQVG
jgi:LmbE family N-acetylglucosaminyl deacetylase